jgi:hypothetical protein
MNGRRSKRRVINSYALKLIAKLKNQIHRPAWGIPKVNYFSRSGWLLGCLVLVDFGGQL